MPATRGKNHGIKVAIMQDMPLTLTADGTGSADVREAWVGNGPIRHFWLSLITLCASAALATALGLAIVSATAVLAAGTVQDRQLLHDAGQDSPGEGPSYAGVITDTHCGAKHAPKLDKSPADCARACVRNGARYVLVDGDKRYFLAGSTDEVGKFAGERVTVFGSLDGETIHVTSVEAQL